jgi:site-specific DNA-methyltransferase (adenine-specific)
MNPYYETDYGKLYNGHVLDTLKQLPSDTVSCCVTSPPYWALRDYGTDGVVWDGDADCEHEWNEETFNQHSGRGDCQKSGKYSQQANIPDKQLTRHICSKCGAWKGQLGLEPDFNLYIKHLCDIFDEVKRVLRKDGTCWVNLGDTYSGGGSGQKDTGKHGYPSDVMCCLGNKPSGNTELQNKNLCNIPSRFSIEMQNRGGIMRNKIIWHKPNCMPSSVTDRFTVDFEEIFFFVKNKKYWFEQQLVPYDAPMNRWGGESLKRDTSKTKEYKDIQKIGHSSAFRVGRTMRPNEQGKNMRTVWKIPTQPFPDAHFAVFPEKLVETPIKAGCPKDICTKCGKPREKIFSKQIEVKKYSIQAGYESTNGYTTCDCNAPFVPGIVLDPFMGSGTTAVYCEKNHYRWIGCDVSDKYCEMIKGRLEPYKKQTKLINFKTECE